MYSTLFNIYTRYFMQALHHHNDFPSDAITLTLIILNKCVLERRCFRCSFTWKRCAKAHQSSVWFKSRQSIHTFQPSRASTLLSKENRIRFFGIVFDRKHIRLQFVWNFAEPVCPGLIMVWFIKFRKAVKLVLSKSYSHITNYARNVQFLFGCSKWRRKAFGKINQSQPNCSGKSERKYLLENVWNYTTTNEYAKKSLKSQSPHSKKIHYSQRKYE